MTSFSRTLNTRLLTRICCEFLEVPGLRLTRSQAQRYWNLDEQTCGHVLDFLVETKFLCRRNPDHAYTRLTERRMEIVLPSHARAQVYDVGQLNEEV